MTSTPSVSSWRASRSLASGDIAFPGACSPSRSVVSKMMTSLAMALLRGRKKKTANLKGFAAPVLLRPTFERLLDSYLRARRDPPAERKAQQQDQAKQQRESDGHVRAINLHLCRAVSRDGRGPSRVSRGVRRDTGVRFLGNHSRGEYAEHLGDVYVRAVDLPKSPVRASGACVA